MEPSAADFSTLSAIFESLRDDETADILRSKVEDFAIDLADAASSIEDEDTAIAAYRMAAHMIRQCYGHSHTVMWDIMVMMVRHVDALSEYEDEIFTDWGWPDHAWDVIHGDITETVNWARGVREMYSSDDE